MFISGMSLCIIWALFIGFTIALFVFTSFKRRMWRDALLLCHCLFLFVSALILSWGILPILLLSTLATFVITLLFSLAGIIALVRGGFSLTNALSLIFLIVMWASFFAWDYLGIAFVNSWLGLLLVVPLGFIDFCIFFTFVILLFYSCVYCIVPKRKDVRYIIILGAGIIIDEPSPLLKSRLNTAIEAWDKGGRIAKLVCSGGQGKDEVVSEAFVMAKYLRQNGIPEDCILLEDKSTNTLENMEYSKRIIDADSDGVPGHCLFVTNNFHVLRSALYARQVHLDAEGLGCKTALWYWPSMFVREYVALAVRHWPKFLLVGLGVLIVLILVCWLYVRSYDYYS